MKITIVFTGKTEKGFVSEGILRYEKRIRHYIPLDIVTVNSPKAGNQENQKQKEGMQILSKIHAESHVILLDEKGDEITSVQFAEIIDRGAHNHIRRLTFVFGGPYGVSEKVRQRADRIIRLSAMTFSHQVVRILFMEQLYRAFTIIRGEPYHHE